MRTRRVLGLGTYPIIKPIHGGQRRVAAYKQFYESLGVEYSYFCIYNSTHYPAHEVGPDDLPLIVPFSEISLSFAIGDVMAGRQFVSDAATLTHAVALMERIRPDVVQLEQSFMWPLAKRLRQAFDSRPFRLIYSSQNVEAPLKRMILSAHGMPSAQRAQICDEIEQMEAELCRAADLIVCVSASDREHYRQYKEAAQIVVVPNGVDRPPEAAPGADAIRPMFDNRPFLMTVGSAHTPNIEGICHYILPGGIFCVPPVTSIAICGGVCEPVFRHPDYQRYVGANSARVRFFPDIDDAELWAIKQSCHGVLLPIRVGGGSNLKTSEALALGKWTISTPTALRGFESHADSEGLIVTDDPSAFRRAMREVLQRPPLRISEASRAARDALYWDRCFADSALTAAAEKL